MSAPLHQRKQIRDAMVAQLKAANTSAADRVLPSRVAPVREATLPVICVYTSDEATDVDSMDSAPRYLRRIMNVRIEAWVSAVANPEDAFDAICMEIETAMDGDDSLNDTCSWCWPSAAQFGITASGDRPMGCARLEYTVIYYTDLATDDQDAARDKLNTIDAKFRIAPGQADADQTEIKVTGLNP
jgi:hypothetical protein